MSTATNRDRRIYLAPLRGGGARQEGIPQGLKPRPTSEAKATAGELISSLLRLLGGWAGGCRVELLGGQLAGGALGVLVLQLRVDLFGSVGLALVLVELGKLELGEAGWH